MEEDDWILPVLAVSQADILQLSCIADKTNPKKPNMQEAARILNKCFTICSTDRSPVESTKKRATLYISNLLFRAYFYLNQTNLCKNILRALDVVGFSNYQPKELVAFNYWKGRYLFLNEQYVDALECFSFALKHTHSSSQQTLEKLTIYYIPLNAFVNGILPCLKVFDRYAAARILYKDLIQAIKTGNLVAFDRSFESLMPKFLQTSTWLICEKLRLFCSRNLLKRVYKFVASTRIPLNAIIAAFQLAGLRDAMEIEMSVAALIDIGLVKGYLSHEKAFLVLSAKDPFPKVGIKY